MVNKTDDESKENDVYEFSSLGLGDPLPISAKAYRGIRELKKTIADIVPEIAESLVDPTLLKIAVAGRRNVGKSSFINYIAGEERVIVSSHAGTTRDSIDVEINNGSKHFVLIDTAGMRKKTKFESAIEFFSACRTEIAIKRADIVLLFLDAVEGISNVDAKLAQIIQEEGKLCIVVTTKMDLAKEIERVKYKRYIDDHLPGLSFAPLIFISSKTGENIWKLIDLAFDINTQGAIKIATSDINEILYEAQRKHPHEVVHGVRPKFFYGTQIKESPPRILIFVRHKKHIKKNYTRFLGNEFRRQLKTPETPYSFVYRENQRNTHNNINEDDNDEGVLETTPEFLDYYDEENDEGHSV